MWKEPSKKISQKEEELLIDRLPREEREKTIDRATLVDCACFLVLSVGL